MASIGRAAMDFPKAIQTKAHRVPSLVRTTEDAVLFIDRELLPETGSTSRWTFARELLLVANQSGKKRDLKHAYRQFLQALSNDRLLEEGEPAGTADKGTAPTLSNQ
jgi:hypothetical protein